MNKGLIFVISGPAGSGKGTVVNLIRNRNPRVGLSVSATTRDPRPGEKDGVSYFFMTKEKFASLLEAGEILEHTEYCSNFYGTLRSEVVRITEEGRDVILEIEVDGAMQVKRLIGDGVVTIMLAAPGAAELERRLRGRGTESEESIVKRLTRAKEELATAPRYDYFVTNETDRAEECADLVMKIMAAEHSRSERSAEYIGEYISELDGIIK
ncbi:MAG: guanylate kinase [Clostridia bacterium]|nr:guanylate kinase [Clostridia bacterium]